MGTKNRGKVRLGQHRERKGTERVSYLTTALGRKGGGRVDQGGDRAGERKVGQGVTRPYLQSIFICLCWLL